MKLEFNDRTTYLAQVALWKAAYADHSQHIRETRWAFRQAQSDLSHGTGSWTTVEHLRHEVTTLRDQATALLGDRHAAKVEAQRQWEARRQAQAA